LWSVLFICKNIRGSLRGRKFGQTYKVGDTFTLKELLGKEDIKYRAFTEYSPHGLEMLKKQELCKDYMQGLEPC
jgi:hypothetical protein